MNMQMKCIGRIDYARLELAQEDTNMAFQRFNIWSLGCFFCGGGTPGLGAGTRR